MKVRLEINSYELGVLRTVLEEEIDRNGDMYPEINEACRKMSEQIVQKKENIEDMTTPQLTEFYNILYDKIMDTIKCKDEIDPDSLNDFEEVVRELTRREEE